MELPSWNEFIEKRKRLEVKFQNIINNTQRFRNEHPILGEAVKTTLGLLPPPFYQISEAIYRNTAGSDEEKLNVILSYFNYLVNQGESHYNEIRIQLNHLLSGINDNLISTSNVQDIQDILISSKVSTERLRTLENEINQLMKDKDRKNVIQVTRIVELSNYYNIKMERIADINNSTLIELKSLVEDWYSSDGKGKKIILVTGQPGSGKSYLAYRLVSDLMNQRYKILIINGLGINEYAIVKPYKDYDNLKEQEKCVFILDGDRIDTEQYRSLSADDIYEFIKQLADSFFLAGPLILTIREDTWNYIINGAQSRIPLSQDRVIETVDKIRLERLDRKEVEKLIESFEKSGLNDAQYSGLNLSSKDKQMIIDKSGGNAMIAALLFDQLYMTRGGKIQDEVPTLPAETPRATSPSESTPSNNGIDDRADYNTLTSTYSPKIFQTDSEPYGFPYEYWSQEWWHWVLSNKNNPIIDETGQYCAENQNHPVWFLAGTFGKTIKRKCTMPVSKAILFPIFNLFSLPEYFEPHEDPNLPYYYNLELDQVKFKMLDVSVDGTKIEEPQRFRIRSGPFFVKFPEGNAWQIKPNSILSMVSDGYWLILHPLSEGMHRINCVLEAAINDKPFKSDITYDLLVRSENWQDFVNSVDSWPIKIVICNTSERITDPKGEPLYSWKIFIKQTDPKSVMQSIDSVTYHLHHTFKQRDYTIKRNEDPFFMLKGKGWGEFIIKLDINIKGRIVNLEHYLSLSSRGENITIRKVKSKDFIMA